MKEFFFEQFDLLVATYTGLDANERASFDVVIDHVTAILYELLHPEELEGSHEVMALTSPLPGGRVLH